MFVFVTLPPSVLIVCSFNTPPRPPFSLEPRLHAEDTCTPVIQTDSKWLNELVGVRSTAGVHACAWSVGVLEKKRQTCFD